MFGDPCVGVYLPLTLTTCSGICGPVMLNFVLLTDGYSILYCIVCFGVALFRSTGVLVWR
jgi:hypothetical protein